MDGAISRKTQSAGTVPRRIGFVGKGNASDYETFIIYYIGRCIARLGHTTVIIPAKGTTDALRKGVEVEEGRLDIIAEDIIGSSDHTWIYGNIPLLQRMRRRYPDLDTRPDVLIIDQNDLEEWFDSVRNILRERGVELPN